MGGGNQADKIGEFIEGNDTGVFYHGYLEKGKMTQELAKYHVSIIPLTARIKGAVPSKIYDLLPVGIPILFCGGGEGASIVMEYGLGMVSEPANIAALKDNIKAMENLPEEEYQRLRSNCLSASISDFSFDRQMDKYYHFLQNN